MAWPSARIPAESPHTVDRASGRGRRQEPRQTEFELQGHSRAVLEYARPKLAEVPRFEFRYAKTDSNLWTFDRAPQIGEEIVLGDSGATALTESTIPSIPPWRRNTQRRESATRLMMTSANSSPAGSIACRLSGSQRPTPTGLWSGSWLKRPPTRCCLSTAMRT